MSATTAVSTMRGARVAATLGFAAVVVGLALFAVAAPGHLAEDGAITCPFRLLTHVRCPLCGMTRATARMARGDFAGALHLHPLAPLLLVVVVGGALAWLAAVALARPTPWLLRARPRAYVAFGVVVWAANLAFGHG